MLGTDLETDAHVLEAEQPGDLSTQHRRQAYADDRMSVAAIHLPATNATRGAGFTSRGSSDPRSRSPAVESVAICPPTKPATMMNIGMNVRICAARCCAVETSISSIASGASQPGSRRA